MASTGAAPLCDTISDDTIEEQAVFSASQRPNYNEHPSLIGDSERFVTLLAAFDLIFEIEGGIGFVGDGVLELRR